MSVGQYNMPTNSERLEFAHRADRWAGVGLWCTLWNRDGQLISEISQSSAFWRTLWSSGQGLRKEIARAVRAQTDRIQTSKLLDVEGLWVQCCPFEFPESAPGMLAMCYVGKESSWGEDFARLCNQGQLDEQVLRDWGRQQQRFTSHETEAALALALQSFEALFQESHHISTAENISSQLGSAHAELDLIYRVGNTMRVTQKPAEHFGRLFADLARTTSITTFAVVLTDAESLDSEDRVTIGGEAVVDSDGVLKIVESLKTIAGHAHKMLVINQTTDHPQLDWAHGWLERLIVVPIVSNHISLGTFLALNHSSGAEFSSAEERLMQAVVDRSAVYLENVLLYGDLNRVLMGLTHALVSSIDAKDPYTCGHSNRVALISKRVAEKIGAAPQHAKRVYLSGLLHDVGKIGVPDTILCKPGKLTPSEFDEMRRHPEIGAKILSGIKQLRDIVPGVLYHHEWLNGTGYPEGLTEQDIPQMAKIVGLADAFDAMTSVRVYRDALPLAEAVVELRRFAGTQFCPRLVEPLCDLIETGLADELKKVKATISFNSLHANWSRGHVLS